MGIILLPFKMLWALLSLLLNVLGRLFTAVIGLVLMIAGLVLTITILGSFLGIPLIIFGILMVVRSIFR